MAFANVDNLAASDSANSVDKLLQKNLLTTAGVAVAGVTATYGAVVVTTALPIKMLGGTVVASALLIAGDQQAKGNLKVPSFGKKEETAEVKAEA